MVTVYSRENCVQCDFTTRLLDREGIEYEVRDVIQDPEALAKVKELGYLAAPVVITPEGDHWSGFQPERITALV